MEDIPPPTYEQALHHQRVEYDVAPPVGNTSNNDHSEQIRERPARVVRRTDFRLPSTDLTRGPSPEVVTSDALDRRLAVSRYDSDIISVISEADSTTEREANTFVKMALPPMHMCMAVTCLVLNIIAPGVGTALSGWGVFCCTKKNEWIPKESCLSCSLCHVLGLLQLILVPVLLIGWIWSIIWGLALLGVSIGEYHGVKPDDTEERPQSSLVSRIPHLSSTRQAMRQTSASVSPTPTYQTSVSPTPTSQASVSPTPTSQSSVSPTPTSQTSVSPTPTSQASVSPTPTSQASVPPTPTSQA